MRRTLACWFLIMVFAWTSSAQGAPYNARTPFRKSLIDLFLPRKAVDVSRMGINAFVNDSRFGTIQNQFLEVRDTLGIKYVRVLFNWDDNVQPTRNSEPNFAFYDSIVNNLPSNVEAFAVITALPS